MKNTKICFKCKKELSVDNFSKKGFYVDGSQAYQSTCKLCTKEYKDQHYQKNRKYYIDKATKYNNDFLEWFFEIKKKLKCELCGENRYWVLDFHHINPKEKEFHIASVIRRCNKKIILNEIKKCKVLCSNCHRDLHYKEKLLLSSKGQAQAEDMKLSIS